jgi:hypothetical protein
VLDCLLTIKSLKGVGGAWAGESSANILQKQGLCGIWLHSFPQGRRVLYLSVTLDWFSVPEDKVPPIQLGKHSLEIF